MASRKQRPLIKMKGPGSGAPLPKLRLALAALALVMVGAAAAVAVAAWLWSTAGPPGAASPPSDETSGSVARGLVPPPIYEEKPETLPPAEALTRLDERIFTALSQAGIPGTRIRVRVEAGHPQELTQVLVTLDRDQKAGPLADKLSTALSNGQVRLERSATPQGVDLEMRLAGVLTHRLSLLSTAPPPGAPPTAKLPPPAGPLAAVVIDDLGYRMGPVKRLLALDIPITFSILPHAPYGAKISALARKKGLEVLLHLPMEPRSYPRLDPGPGALLSGMEPSRLQALTRSNLDTVPQAVGVNNHMGSKLTEDPAAMDAVMKVLAEKGLFFLDSQTSPKSVARASAGRAGVPSARRQVFLDNDPSVKAVRAQMERVLALARRGVPVIAIGHPNLSTLQVLEEYAPRLKKELSLTAVARLTETPAASQGQARAAKTPSRSTTE